MRTAQTRQTTLLDRRPLVAQRRRHRLLEQRLPAARRAPTRLCLRGGAPATRSRPPPSSLPLRRPRRPRRARPWAWWPSSHHRKARSLPKLPPRTCSAGCRRLVVHQRKACLQRPSCRQTSSRALGARPTRRQPKRTPTSRSAAQLHRRPRRTCPTGWPRGRRTIGRPRRRCVRGRPRRRCFTGQPRRRRRSRRRGWPRRRRRRGCPQRSGPRGCRARAPASRGQPASLKCCRSALPGAALRCAPALEQHARRQTRQRDPSKIWPASVACSGESQLRPTVKGADLPTAQDGDLQHLVQSSLTATRTTLWASATARAAELSKSGGP